MSIHRITIHRNADQFRAVCKCTKSSAYGSRHDAEDWGTHHLEEIQRVRAHLRAAPSLTSQLSWFQQQAEDLTNSARDRELWQQLAEELEARIRPAETTEQERLW